MDELKIKVKGEDGYKTISIRIKEELLEKLGDLAEEAHCSRNELINKILEHGVTIVKIEK